VLLSIPERRFSSNHSRDGRREFPTLSIPERRFSSNHSCRMNFLNFFSVYLSGDSPQTTARLDAAQYSHEVYLSGDSPQTTADVRVPKSD